MISKFSWSINMVSSFHSEFILVNISLNGSNIHFYDSLLKIVYKVLFRCNFCVRDVVNIFY